MWLLRSRSHHYQSVSTHPYFLYSFPHVKPSFPAARHRSVTPEWLCLMLDFVCRSYMAIFTYFGLEKKKGGRKIPNKHGSFEVLRSFTHEEQVRHVTVLL